MNRSLTHSLLSASRRAWKRWGVLSIVLPVALALLFVASASAVAVISATKSDAFIGGDGDGRADPGETIEYTVVVANSGADPATGVVYDDTIDANTTLVGGSVAVSPAAGNDTYPQTVIGNVSINSAQIPYSVISNDYLGLNPTATISAYDATSVQGGQVSMTTSGANIGQFTYNPPPGYEGADSFTYTLADNPNAASTAANRTATVTINVSGMVWFIDNTATTCTTLAAGCGRLSNPFSTLAAFNALNIGTGNNPADNDNIFIYESGTAYTGGVALRSGQRLIGQDAAVSLSTITSLTPPTGSAAFPAMNTGAPATTIQNAGGDGVSVQTNAIPAVIRGLSLSGSTNAVDITISNATAGTLEIKDNIIVGAGDEGIDINRGGSGLLTLDVQDNTWNTAGTHGNAANEHAFDARTTSTGTINLNFGNNTNMLASNASSSGVFLDGSGGGALTVTGFASNSVSGNTAGTGITANTVTFDAAPGGTFQQVSGGSTTIGASGNGVGTSGMALTSVSGDLDFTDLDIFASSGAGLSMTGTGAIAASAGMRLTSTGSVASVDATGGPAVSISSATLNLLFGTITSTNSSSTGVSLTGINDGTTASVFSAGSGSSIANATGTDFVIDSNNADVTYAGTIADNNGGQLVSVSSNTGGTKSFTGAISDGNDGDGSGISLTSNGGATISFSGGVVLSTGANAAFTATGGGTVNVTGSTNTLATTTNTALNVTNTTIGASGLTFRSISSNGATNGIVLNTTGSGGLTVTGNTAGNCGGNVTNSGATVTAPVAADCSGGTILNSTGTGILLTTASNISLTRMRIAGSADDGIGGTTVSGLTLTSSLLENNGNAVGDRGIDVTNLTGSVGIATSTIRSSKEHNIVIANTTGNLTAFNVTNSQIATNDLTPATGTGDDGIQILNNGTGSMAVNVTQSAFTDNKGDHFQTASSASATGSITAVFSNNTLITTAANDPQVVGGGITINPGNAADITFTISNNNIQQAFDDSININHDPSSTAASNLEGTISGNTIGTAGDLGSGSESSNAITLGLKGAGTNTIAVTNNTIREWGNQYCIFVGISEGSASANTTVTNNNCAATFPNALLINGIHVAAGATAGPPVDNGTLCITLTGNNVTGTGNPANGDADIRLRQRFSTTIRLPGYGGANNDTAAVNAFVAANNDPNGAAPPAAPTVSSIHNVGGGGGGYTGGAACTTPIAMAPNTNQFLAQNHLDTAPIVSARAPMTNLQPESAFTTAFNIDHLFKHTAWVKPQGTTVNAATAPLAGNQVGASAKLFAPPAVLALAPPAAPSLVPPQSGENVNVNIGNLPAGKSVTIRFRVTVDDPLPPGTTRLLNQGNVTYTGGPVGGLDTTDPSPNAAPVCAGSGTATCTPVDRPDTTVTSIVRSVPASSLTNAASVTWLVTFADPVTNLTAGNFTLANSGLTGPSITGVAPVGAAPATQWTVTANTGTGDGTLGLDMTGDAGLSHDVTNLAFTGQVYTIDKTAPTVSSIMRQSPSSNPTNADLLVFRVTFNEAVTGVGANSFVATGTTTTIAPSVTAVTPNLVFDFSVNGSLNGNLSNLNGIVGLDVSAGRTITDLAGNLLAFVEPSPASNDQTYTLDNTAPTVSSILRQSPSSNPTNADLLVFRVTFDEAVTGVGANSFVATGTTTTIAPSVTAVTPNLVFDFSVDGSLNGNLSNLNGIVGLDVSAGRTITDLAGNLLAFVEPSPASNDQTYTLDNTAPTVTINQAAGQADPTNSSPINFTVVFDEPVTDFNDTADVTLSGTAGATTINITEIAPNDGTTYNVAVSGMTSNGTVIASVPANAALDLVSLPNGASTSTDNTVTYVPPTDLSITKTDGVTTAAPGGNVTYTITASNAGPNADPAATIADTLPASLSATWMCVGAGGGTCTATGSGNINDTVNLPVGGSVTYTVVGVILPSATGTLANTATVSSSISDIDPANDSASDTDTLTPQADLAITKTDGVTTATPGGSVTYTITASNAGPSDAPGVSVADTFPAILTATWTCVGAGGGTCTAAGSGNINDTVNLPAGGSVTYTVSATISGAATGSLSSTATVAAPGGVTDPDPANNSATDTDTLTPQADLAITKTDGVAFAVAGNSITYTITASNAGPSDAPGATVADTFPASLSGMTWTCVGAGGGTCTAAGSGDINDTVNLPAGGSVTYTANATVSAAATGTLANTATVAAPAGVTDPDPANNSATDTDTVVPPMSVTIDQASDQSDPTSLSPVNFTAVFDDPVTGFTGSDVTLSGSAGATTAVVTEVGPMDGSAYNVAVSGMTTSGTVVATIAAGVATGSQGQSNVASTSTDNTVTFDANPLTVTINQAAPQTDPTSSSPINFVAVFSEGVTGFTGADVSLSGAAGASTAVVTEIAPMNGTTYNVAVTGMTGSGTVIASIPAGGATSISRGVANQASTSTDNSVTFNPVVPVATGIVRANPSPTNAASVQFTVTFSEDVSGVDAGDFGLAASGVSGASIAGVSGSGTTYTVTVNTGSGSGTLGLNLVDDDTIIATNGRPLGGTGAGNGNLTGQVYTIDRTAPQAVSLVAANITTGGGATHSFTVVFGDNLAIDIASLDGSDIRVTGPGGFNQLATFVSVSPAGNGTPRTATYRINAPGGSWDIADNGTYTLALQANQVRDGVGNLAAARVLGTFGVNVGPTLYKLFLPMVQSAGTPDLVITGISLVPSKSTFAAGEPVEVRVTVTNQGSAAAGAFWVDLYINPSSPPTAANQIWNTRCGLTPCFGMAWEVAGGLAPGQSITLSSRSLPAGYSVWLGYFAAGTSDLYAYADSYSPGVVDGSVAESDEANNRGELHGLTVTGPNPALRGMGDRGRGMGDGGWGLGVRPRK